MVPQYYLLYHSTMNTTISTSCSNLLCTVVSVTNIRQFFCIQETNVLNSHFVQLLYSQRMDTVGLKHIWLSGFYIIVNLLQLCIYVGLNYSNNYSSFETWLVSCLMYMVSEGTWFMKLTSHVLIC